MDIVILFLLIILNGVFAMSEIALVSARKIRLQNLAEKGDLSAKHALNLLSNPNKFFSTVQFGVTLISIFLGVYSGDKFKEPIIRLINKWPLLAPYSDTLSLIIVVLLITYFSLVLGELVPKRIGLTRPDSISRMIARPMQMLSTITFPFIWLLSVSTAAILKIFNIKRSTDSHVTEEEIKALISEGTTSGEIEETEQEIIERVFYLGDRNITSLMTHRTDLAWIDLNDNLVTCREKVRSEIHSAYPVCDAVIDEVVGVLYIKDLYVADDNLPVRQLVKKPLFIPENNSAYQVMEKFKESRSHFGFIVDEYGSFQGMITLNDILEAIVGDMPEAGEQDYEIVRRTDGSYLVDAQVRFYDFLNYFEKEDWIEDVEQEFDTLAGFVLYHLEHIPKAGENFSWRIFDFEVMYMDAHRIDKILVTLNQPLENEKDKKGEEESG